MPTLADEGSRLELPDPWKDAARSFKDAIFEQLAQVAAAFGSPKRVEIIDILAQGERTVESIAAVTGMTVGNTSRHLQILRGAGLVATRRDGLYVVYRVGDESVIEAYRMLRSLAAERIGHVRQLAEAYFAEVDGAEPVEMEELLKRVDAGAVTVIDVRPRLEYESGHFPGAVSVPLEEISRRLGELSPQRQVVAYCRGPYCVLSAQAVRQLRAAGLKAARLATGPPDWQAAGIQLATGPDPDQVSG